jgi:hypothetical protein
MLLIAITGTAHGHCSGFSSKLVFDNSQHREPGTRQTPYYPFQAPGHKDI